ncbi:MAG TPA: biotin/lipoate A/B protein ligase family protein, partial [Nitrospiria bacterium]|nr:biotin/lipoate A/B protein ligase family protein [Nitrospiria bacterium]
PSTIRFYTWANPAVSIGAFQPLRDVNLDRCKQNDIRVVRRITGGRALLHQKELTYSVICSIPSPFFPSNLQGCCRVIAEALQLGLQQLGLYVQIVSPESHRPRSPHQADCFSSPSVYEITVDGRKLIGSAQRRWLRVFLQHGSLPIQTDRESEKELIIGTIGNPSQRAVRLSELLNPLPSIKKLKDALTWGFEKKFGIILEEGALTPEEEKLAEELGQARYAAETWTRRR